MLADSVHEIPDRSGTGTCSSHWHDHQLEAHATYFFEGDARFHLCGRVAAHVEQLVPRHLPRQALHVLARRDARWEHHLSAGLQVQAASAHHLVHSARATAVGAPDDHEF